MARLTSRGSRVPASASRPSSKMSERRLACARSSSSPAGMSVDHSVMSRSRSSTVPAASAMSREATAAAKSASRSRTRSTSGDVLGSPPALVAGASSRHSGLLSCSPSVLFTLPRASASAVSSIRAMGNTSPLGKVADRPAARTVTTPRPSTSRSTGVKIENAGRVLVDPEHEGSARADSSP